MAYYTIIGRFDQFLFGIIAFPCRDILRGRHWLTGFVTLAFMAFYWWFDAAGGFFLLDGKYPAASALWIWLPTIQGAIFAWVIAYYDASVALPTGGFSKLLSRIGTYSYSIYLLHPFFVFRMPVFIDRHILPLSNFYVACVASLACFCGMTCVGWASYNFIEKPFLRFRVRYTRPAAEAINELAPA